MFAAGTRGSDVSGAGWVLLVQSCLWLSVCLAKGLFFAFSEMGRTKEHLLS